MKEWEKKERFYVSEYMYFKPERITKIELTRYVGNKEILLNKE